MSPRADINAFASCPAATGENNCPHYPDRAHRCGQPRDSHLVHQCTCAYPWAVTYAARKPITDTTHHLTP
jgi:hypothetical protein